MAVEIKYVVVRKGEEKMTFASKKEADAYDKMLDMAEAFTDWLGVSSPTMAEEQRESLGMFLAENKEAVQHILRTRKMPEASDNAGAEKGGRAAATPDKPVAEDQQAVEDAEPASGKSARQRAAKAA